MMTIILGVTKFYHIYIFDVPKEFRTIMLIRCFLGFTSVMAWWEGMKYIPVSISNCIVSMGQLFSTVWARIFLEEPILKIDIFSILLAFIGVIIINDPFSSASSEEYESVDKDDFLFGSMITLISSFSFSISITMMRKMKVGIHHSISPFFMALGGALFGPPAHLLELSLENN